MQNCVEKFPQPKFNKSKGFMMVAVNLASNSLVNQGALNSKSLVKGSASCGFEFSILLSK